MTGQEPLYNTLLGPCKQGYYALIKSFYATIQCLLVDQAHASQLHFTHDVVYVVVGVTHTSSLCCRQLVDMDGDKGHARFFYQKTIIPFLFGRTWISSSIGKDDGNRKKLQARLDELVQGTEERGVFVLFPDGQDLGCFQSSCPGHLSSMPISASRVCRVASASQHTPAATAITGLGPPRAMHMQVRQPPSRFRRPLAPGYMPRGRIGCSGFR